MAAILSAGEVEEVLLQSIAKVVRLELNHLPMKTLREERVLQMEITVWWLLTVSYQFLSVGGQSPSSIAEHRLSSVTTVKNMLACSVGALKRRTTATYSTI